MLAPSVRASRSADCSSQLWLCCNRRGQLRVKSVSTLHMRLADVLPTAMFYSARGCCAKLGQGTFMICIADALGGFDAACPCRLAVKLPVRDMLDPMRHAMTCS